MGIGSESSSQMRSKIEQGREDSAKVVRDCSTTREYAATLMFLREKSDLAGNEPQSREIADQVSLGCTGAARRFINTALLLEEAEVDNSTIRELAVAAAQADDATASAFSSIFQKSYLKSYLDLDLEQSIQLAKSLSLKFKGEPAMAERDFCRLVQFCTGEKGLNLSRQQCAEFSARVAAYGADDRREIYPAFKDVYDYIATELSARPSVGETLKISEEIVKTGPLAVENFKQAFKFASAKKGLALKEGESLEFARKMASRSRQRVSRVEK
jgi:hypothetical protein